MTQSPKALRLGMLTPSSNTVLEPETQALLAPMAGAVSAHFGRFRVTQIGLDTAAESQFALEPILVAADLLADAKPDVIAWNGTSASWRGFDTDRRLCAEIAARSGVQATSAVLAFNAAMAALGVKRLGLVTPYTPDVQAAISRNYAAHGIDIAAEAHAGLRDNYSFAELSEDRVAQMCRDVAASRPDAIAIVCTNMRGARRAAALEAELNIPILDSVAVTLWGCLTKIGADPAPLKGFGRLFALRAPGDAL
ncbi:maleate cis-trans isomerase family protein [Pseudotabrizicola algicola]|uniref:Asp/Glu/hydantoin racemase n=1 Tax=Pseudotabrizicola algicola TaxID=2709381 RepID=A0A6B3RRN5_9RHOB|nr:aspartate/glutamate racemase family protein [Pseudotabrizicola algicola]NEX48810.1 Asp/Glu/hydantoin racemase [Pseudotabrizicola algicola]